MTALSIWMSSARRLSIGAASHGARTALALSLLPPACSDGAAERADGPPDFTGNPSAPLYDFRFAVERVGAARRAIDESGGGLLLTARSEGFLVGRPDLAETVRRLEAFAEAGADCLYAPGIRSAHDIAAVVAAVSPRPVNVLVGSDFTTVGTLAALGVRRISVGGALARAAWAGFLAAAREIAEHGTFTALGRAVPFAEIDAMFRDPENQRTM